MTIAHISNGELGFDVRTKLNGTIDLANNLPVASLNGGTLASSTTFWRGDGTWATPAGGGGSMAIGGAITSATAGSVLFAGAAGVLAQDNANFFWDDALNDLHIGGAYYVNAARALYVVPNVTENNWFEGNAGNQTVTGYGNFATGDLSLSAITSGHQNVAMGTGALRYLTTGNGNFALGSHALYLTDGGDSDNIAIGPSALQSIGQFGSGSGTNVRNIGIGYSAMGNMIYGANNVAIGFQPMGALTGSTIATFNVVIGNGAGQNLGSGGGGTVQYNTLIGPAAGLNLSGASGTNTWIGGYRGPSATVNGTIALSDGSAGQAMFDFGVTSNQMWTFANNPGGNRTMIHIYNNTNTPGSPGANYERAIIGWEQTGLDYFLFDTQAAGSGTKRIIAIGCKSKAGAPAAADLPANSFSVIDDTSANKTWLAFNKAGTIRQTEIGGGGGGGMAIGGAITSATAGSVLFADASGNLGQNNANFSWDYTNLRLKVGSVATPVGEYWLNNVRALYGVNTSGGTSWFEAGAGNSTLTGALNFGTGDGCLAAVTSGDHNTALGAKALGNMLSGSQNIALGSQALWLGTLDSNNIAIGFNALVTLGNGGAGGGGNSGNIGIGLGVLGNVSIAANNVILGFSAMAPIIAPTTASYNTVLGSGAGGNLGVGGGASVDNNVMIGANAGYNLNGASSGNVWIGGYRGPSALLSNTIAISDGANSYSLLDFMLTTNYTWSFAMSKNTVPAMIHIYNRQNPAYSVTNYERGFIGFDDYGITPGTIPDTFCIGTQAGGTGTRRNLAITGWPKAGAPAAADLPAGYFSVIDDTSAGQTWLVFNKAGTVRKVQLT